jgi:hypothetical protein
LLPVQISIAPLAADPANEYHREGIHPAKAPGIAALINEGGERWR